MCKCPKCVGDIDDLCDECRVEYDKYLDNLIEQLMWGYVELEDAAYCKQFVWHKGGSNAQEN